MEHVRWSSRPRLRTPVVIAAFAGWNDAGEAASNAGHHLADVWATRPFATIDAEDFYDFSSTRPHVRLVDGGQREIVWPINELSASSVLGADMDVVLLIGTEPQLKWRTFCSEVLEVVTELNARMLITLGALLAEVPHSRPVSVIGTAADPTLIEQHGLQRSHYEGPTGIVGALHDACNTAGLPSLSLWAAVPAYVQGAPSPKAALALVERVGDVLDLMIPTTALEIASAAYEREVDEVVTNDDELSGYVRRLEDMVDSGEPFGDDDEDEAIGADDTVDDLVEELERFLRDQQGD
jgi:proteasome assembly chaperone (PAC2) family protein